MLLAGRALRAGAAHGHWRRGGRKNAECGTPIEQPGTTDCGLQNARNGEAGAGRPSVEPSRARSDLLKATKGN